MEPEAAHLLTGGKVLAAVGLFGPVGVGLALMSFGFPHLSLVFWLGFSLSLLGAIGTYSLGHSEIRKGTHVGALIGGMAAIDIVAPLAVFFYAASETYPGLIEQEIVVLRLNGSSLILLFAGIIVVSVALFTWNKSPPSHQLRVISAADAPKETGGENDDNLRSQIANLETERASLRSQLENKVAEAVLVQADANNLRNKLQAAAEQLRGQQIASAEFQRRMSDRVAELERVRQNTIGPRCVTSILGVIGSRRASLNEQKILAVVSYAGENRGLAASLTRILQQGFQVSPGLSEALRFVPLPDVARFLDAPVLNGGTQRGITIHGDSAAARLMADAMGAQQYMLVRQTKTFVADEAKGQDVRDMLLDYYRTRFETPVGPLVGYDEIIWLQIGPGNPWGPNPCD
jgi:hypothetical protein